MESAMLRWLEERNLERPAMRTLLIGALAGALALAQQIDPELRLEPANLVIPGDPANPSDERRER
jgi:hypothetical protein